MFIKLRNFSVFVFFALCFISIPIQGQTPSPTPLADKTQVPIGQLKASEAIKKLEEIGAKDDVKAIKKALKKSSNKSVQLNDLDFALAAEAPKIWKYNTRAFGFISATAMVPGGANLLDITDAGNMVGDNTLKGTFIKITLDRLRVADYPGDGIHLILFDFYAQHQAVDLKEDLHFSQTYRVLEGQGGGLTGNPIFLGLKVTNEGVSFRFQTVNVSNEDDEKLLAFLNGDQFNNGLQLINAINPLVPIVSGFATGIVKSIASKNKNIFVQDGNMGLDFSNIPTRAKLREGAYIAVQAPGDTFDWSKWKFNRTSGEIVSIDDNTKTIPYNYIVFSISKMQ